MFRREWRQQVLMLALVTAVVAGAVAVASMAVNAASRTSDEFGAGGALTRAEVASPDEMAATIAEAKRQFGRVEVIRHLSAVVPGAAERLDVRAQDPDGIFGHPMLDVRRGRYPTTADEVALTDGAAALLGADIGDHVDLGGRARTIVGRVENPGDLHDEFALLTPSEDAPADSLTFLLASGHRGSRSASARAGTGTNPNPDAPPEVRFVVIVGGNDKAAVAGGVLAITTLAMTLVALVAAAGFLVIAQRRQRQLGLLAALGARARHQRLVLLANGALVGLVSAVAGAALGVVGWFVAAPVVETAAAHRIDRLDLPWGLIVECMALAVVSAVAASWWPARTVTRQPVMAALSRRPARRPKVRRSTAAGAVLMVAGPVAIALAFPSTAEVRTGFLMGGLVTLIVGVVLMAPLAIRGLAAPAGRMPVTTRLALRDLVRYQARASAALAAITLGLGSSVTVVILAKANEYRSDEGNLSDRQLVVRAGGAGPFESGLNEANGPRLDETATRISQAIGAADRLPLDVALDPRGKSGGESVSVARPIGGNGYRFVDAAYVGNAAMFDHFGIDPATFANGTDLVTARAEEVILLDPTARPDPTGKDRVQHVVLPAYSSAPTSFITEGAVERHHWKVVRAGWLIESTEPLSTKQLEDARSVAATAGLAIEARSGQDDLATLRTVATGVGAALALAIIAMTIGLIRSESAGDLRTLTATGAAARTRRALTANTAGSLAVLGVVLGTGGAYLALVASYHADLSRLSSPPFAELALVALGIPAVATAAGWLLAGREPRTFSRQATD